MDHFDPYNVLLAIATNIPVLLMTGFVVQDYICIYIFCGRHKTKKCSSNQNVCSEHFH